ncbi:MAG: PhzF family phenazine biosynthesis protein [bacterium]|nr:PhzF family phenazine biosynthesis protein [bacterium]
MGPVQVQHHPGATPPLWVEQPEPVLGETLPVDMFAAILTLPQEAFVEDLPHVVVPVADRSWLGRVNIDLARYYRLVEETGIKNILVYAEDPHEPGQDLAVRMFADALGIPEDPATGSGNGCLAAYLIHHDRTGAETLEFVVGQGYEMGRSSQLWLQARRSDGVIRVRLGGYSVDVAEGTWKN